MRFWNRLCAGVLAVVVGYGSSVAVQAGQICKVTNTGGGSITVYRTFIANGAGCSGTFGVWHTFTAGETYEEFSNVDESGIYKWIFWTAPGGFFCSQPITSATIALTVNGSGGWGSAATTNCWWQASIGWTNKSDVWAVLDFTVTDADGDQTGLADVPLAVGSGTSDPNLASFAGIPVAPGAAFVKTVYFGADSAVSPFTFIAGGGTPTTPTWVAGDSRPLLEGKARVPDSSGQITKICSTNSVPTNAPPGTVEEVSLSLTNGFNPFTPYTNKWQLPAGPNSRTNPATSGDVDQLASVTLGSAAQIERAIRESAKATGSDGAGQNLLVLGSLTNINTGIANVHQGVTNLVAGLTNVLNAIQQGGTNGSLASHSYFTNANGKATNMEVWIGQQGGFWTTNPWAAAWGSGASNATGSVGGVFGGTGSNTWGDGGAGLGEHGQGVLDVIAGLEAPGAGWGEIPLGWSGWKLDLKALLSGDVLENPGTAIIGEGAFGTTMAGVNGIKNALRTFLIWSGLVTLYLAISGVMYGLVRDVLHTPTIPQQTYLALGTTIPGVATVEQIAKATILTSSVLVLPSLMVALLATVGIASGDVVSTIAQGGANQLNTAVSGFSQVLYCVNQWFPFGEYAFYGVNFVASVLLGEVVAVKLMTMAKFL